MDRRSPAGFDFCRHMRAVCADMALRLPELSHLEIDRVAIVFAQARKRTSHGLYATLTPMRFEGGAETTLRYGTRYRTERLLDSSGREMLYILSFYLPRFMDVDFHEKLVTILHELWHVSPGFDGDLRRFAGRCYAHSHSQQAYDAEMAVLARKWLALDPPPAVYRFLENSFNELYRAHGRVFGTRVRHPKLIPVA